MGLRLEMKPVASALFYFEVCLTSVLTYTTIFCIAAPWTANFRDSSGHVWSLHWQKLATQQRYRGHTWRCYDPDWGLDQRELANPIQLGEQSPLDIRVEGGGYCQQLWWSR